MRYILHYTEPGDLIFDGFAGSGMTGVAAQMCGMPDSETKFTIEHELIGESVHWGTRKTILNDLSVAASFIGYGKNLNVDPAWYSTEAGKALAVSEQEYGWAYKIRHMTQSYEQLRTNEGALLYPYGYSVRSAMSPLFPADLFCPASKRAGPPIPYKRDAPSCAALRLFPATTGLTVCDRCAGFPTHK
ncbi:MAG: site-specific DNA-methyltransferase [Clostridiales bacterium]|nr:site-specific DNA-methyltransferase [Clostridiales bacterium]